MEHWSEPMSQLSEASPEPFHVVGFETEISDPGSLEVPEDDLRGMFEKQGQRKGRPKGRVTKDVTSHLIVKEKRRPDRPDTSPRLPVRRRSVRLAPPSPPTPPPRGRGRPRKGEELPLKSLGTSSRTLLYLLESSSSFPVYTGTARH